MKMAPKEILDVWKECASRALNSGLPFYRVLVSETEFPAPFSGDPAFSDIKTVEFQIELHELPRERRRVVSVYSAGALVDRFSEPL